jgi:acylphosphatase
LEKARESGLFGWVRNLRDGSVEAVFEGEEESIKKAIKWCKTSQPFARVDNIEVKWSESTGEFTDFEIRH